MASVAADLAGSEIDPLELSVVVDDAPDRIVDFLQADVLVLERVAEEVLTGEQPEVFGSTDLPDLEVPRVLGVPEAARVLLLGRVPAFGGEVSVAGEPGPRAT